MSEPLSFSASIVLVSTSVNMIFWYAILLRFKTSAANNLIKKTGSDWLQVATTRDYSKGSLNFVTGSYGLLFYVDII